MIRYSGLRLFQAEKKRQNMRFENHLDLVGVDKISG
jgi:hypothetical protein